MAYALPPPGGGGKRGQGHRMVPLPPLDSPKPSFAPRLPSVAQRNGEKRGLGSVRRADFGTLSGPEVSLRYPPRITVRGQTVQGAGFALRKAPLRSSVYSWSSRRPCGPLAFRRATEGSRVQRKVGGVKRGQETIWCPVPFCPCRWAPTPPAAGRRHPLGRGIRPLLPPSARRSFATAQKKTLQRQRVVVC